MGLKRRRAVREAPPEAPPVSTGPAALVTIDALGRKCPIPSGSARSRSAGSSR
jgi:hypothetical protein